MNKLTEESTLSLLLLPLVQLGELPRAIDVAVHANDEVILPETAVGGESDEENSGEPPPYTHAAWWWLPG